MILCSGIEKYFDLYSSTKEQAETFNKKPTKYTAFQATFTTPNNIYCQYHKVEVRTSPAKHIVFYQYET